MAKSKKFVYIAGPMTGIPQFNFPLFDSFRDVYKDMGYTVFNPADHDRSLLNKPKDWLPTEADQEDNWKRWSANASATTLPTLRDMLGADLHWIASTATHIAMIPGWEKSSGANAEWALAKALGLEIHYYPMPNDMILSIRKESRMAA